MLMSEAQRKRLFKIRAAMDGGVTLAAEKGAAAVNKKFDPAASF